ncbi:L-histidine N(alpha)-methyltransferase [Bdellovibrio sp. HCB2-146]|uniref:L-histidine N(alpha)-methyltransferase n=1 Tax=Bdellovibrio sp. HCB2-146 TaxID=3394362 RepID=UPI0039BCC1D1
MDVNSTLEIVTGLTAAQKRLPSKLFYDDNGTALFRKITEAPEYYLTTCEKEILRKNADFILDQMENRPFNLIELGAGDGSKASLLIKKAMTRPNFRSYYAYDISKKALEELEANLEKSFPDLEPHLVIADYTTSLEELDIPSQESNIFLFLGSSIGNFSPSQASLFLEKLSHKMKDGDFLLVGFDLKKAERILYKAYNDSQGLTAEFNLNLLLRLNREYGANFNIENFKHVEIYNPGLGAMESYLLSLKEQTVYFEDLNLEIHFQQDEMIHTELSYKFSVEDIENLVKDTSLKALSFLFDHKRYFVSVLFHRRSLH